MKIKKSELKSCYCAYLYRDGHFVMVHEKRDKDAGRVNWVTIYQDIGIKVSLPEGYRIIIHPEVIPFILPATRIDGKAASVERGSENTKKRGIAVETISFYNGHDYRSWHITNFPDLVASDIHLNRSSSTFEDTSEAMFWGSHRVKNIYKEKTV